MRHSIERLGLIALIAASAPSHGTVEARQQDGRPFFRESALYDWGWYGTHPQQRYHSFGSASPKPNMLLKDERCDKGLVFVEPRETHKRGSGPVILDGKGNLVWMPTRWGRTRDMKVQQFNGIGYITLWVEGQGTPNDGYYVMLGESYELFKEVRPIGNLEGDLQDLQITSDGTAIVTISREMQVPASSSPGFICDDMFQEIDLVSGELRFEWHASRHFPIHESKGRRRGRCKADFHSFPISGIDKDAEGNYLVSSGVTGVIAYVSGQDGRVLWQLGGSHSDFDGLPDGVARDFSRVYRGVTEDESMRLITIDDDGRKLIVELNPGKKTAVLVQSSSSPPQPLAKFTSQSSVQVLANENMLVSWSDIPGFTEFSEDGRLLCDTHLGPAGLSTLGLGTTTYRVSKFDWVGRPKTKPTVAIHGRNRKSASLYVSWNGATEVDAWVLQSGPEEAGNAFFDHVTVPRTGFETKIPLPENAAKYVRVLALASGWRGVKHAVAVSKHTEYVIRPQPGSWREEPVLQRCNLDGWRIGALMVCIAAIYWYTIMRKRRSRGMTASWAPHKSLHSD